MTSVREERMGAHFVKFHLHDLPPYAVLHKFTAADTGDAHDHPFDATSLIISGGYIEEVYQQDGSSADIHRQPGDTFENAASHIHQLIELPEGECWTLIIPGPPEQTSGFWQFRPDGAYRRAWNEAEFARV